MKLAHLHPETTHEPIWHIQAAVLVAVSLQITLNDQLTVGPKYVIGIFELLLLVTLAALQPRKPKEHTTRVRRGLAIILIALISVANITSLVLVLHALLNGSVIQGNHLILSALSIFLTNIIIFGVWYWELDGGGTGGRGGRTPPVDFMFPQMTSGEALPSVKTWQPTFFDYLYLSTTNATAFSPTDTLPLTHRAKLLMSIQALASLATIALVAARAVNILH